jgi:hypothetical protein
VDLVTADLLDIRLVKREVKAWLASNVPKEWGRERVVLSYRSAKAIGQIGNVKWEFGIFSNRDEGVNCTMRAGGIFCDFDQDPHGGPRGSGPLPGLWTFRPSFEMQERIGREATYYTNREKVQKIYWRFSGDEKDRVTVENERQLALYCEYVLPAAVTWAQKVLDRQRVKLG